MNMTILKIRNISIMMIAGLFVVSCNVTKKYQFPDNLATEKLFREIQSNDSVKLSDIPWRDLFQDDDLRSLIDTALNNNLDLKIAVARMESAAANLDQSKLAFLPTLNANFEVTKSQPSPARANGVNASNIPSNTIYALTGSSSWELDIWGKIRSNKRAVAAGYLQSEAYQRVIQTQLIATLSMNYYQLLAYDQQIEIIEATIENRSRDVEVLKKLKIGAVVTGADVVNGEALLKAAKLQLPDLKQARRELENAISILLAQPPAEIKRSKFDVQNLTPSLTTGIPLDILSNRPDVQQAELSFRSAFEMTNVARTSFYPSVTLSATGGWATANTIKGFFDGTFYSTLIGGLTQPIFNQGLNRQRLKVAEAWQKEMKYIFQNTLLNAGQEISNALYSYEQASEKYNLRQQQIADYEKAVCFTKELLKYSSTTNYTDVLTAEQNLLFAKLDHVADKLQQMQAIVELYRALGGGWDRIK